MHDGTLIQRLVDCLNSLLYQTGPNRLSSLIEEDVPRTDGFGGTLLCPARRQTDRQTNGQGERE